MMLVGLEALGHSAITSNNRTLSEIAYLHLYGIAPTMAFFLCAFIMMRARSTTGPT